MNIALVTDRSATEQALQSAIARRGVDVLLWQAGDLATALVHCAAQEAELLIIDMGTERLDSVDTTRRIMSHAPCPILLITSNLAIQTGRVFDAMGAGALDAMELSAEVQPWEASRELARKLGTLAKLLGSDARSRTGMPSLRRPGGTGRASALVAIGASAGGPSALASVLGDLPPELPAALVVVQHVNHQFTSGMTRWLSQRSALPIRIAEEGDIPRAGTVYFAGTSDHLVVKPGRLGYSAEPVENIYRPSIDVLFESAARHWTGDLVAVLLTGMGSDGAAGLRRLRDLGHHTIAQDRQTSAVYGMPKAAVAVQAAVQVLPVQDIAMHLRQRLTAYGFRVLREGS